VALAAVTQGNVVYPTGGGLAAFAYREQVAAKDMAA
jgi:hypothetical protein